MTKEVACNLLTEVKIKILPSGCHIPINYDLNTKDHYPIKMLNYKNYYISRLILLVHHDIEYDDKFIVPRHTCDYKPCINKDHIIPGSYSDNTNDLVKSGLHHHARKENCPKCGSAYNKVHHRDTGRYSFHRMCYNCKNIKRREKRKQAKLETRNSKPR